MSRSRQRIAASQNVASGSLAAGSAAREQRQLGDRAVDEEVDDRVAVVGGGEVLVGADHVDRLAARRRSATTTPLLDERVERAPHAVGGVELELRR